MTSNNMMMQFLSDILQVKIERPANQESTAIGAAYLAGIYAGIYKDVADVEKLWKTDQIFEPKISIDQAEQFYDGWKKTIERLISNG
jgi:glycerol kinase